MASPTDSIMSPCSKMLQQHKMRHFGKYVVVKYFLPTAIPQEGREEGEAYTWTLIYSFRTKPRLLNNAFAQRATSNSTEAEKDKENQKRMVATGSGANVTATATGPGTGTGTGTGLFGGCAAAPISKDGSIF